MAETEMSAEDLFLIALERGNTDQVIQFIEELGLSATTRDQFGRVSYFTFSPRLPTLLTN